MQLRNEPVAAPHRQRCYVCYRPVASCFCDVIPHIDNRTHILILQHVKERFHAFNTARIVRQALQNSELIVDQTSQLARTDLPLHENTGLLYPGPNSQLLSSVPEPERPQQLVILDGTWHHAKTFMREIPVLATLPRYRLEPAKPSNYRIRKEPSETAISTLEATVDALRSLEPETAGLDQLLQAFDHMIDTHLQHPQQAGRLRKPSARGVAPANIPRALLDDIDNIVVVYGEASHSRNNRRGPQEPVYWVAQRLGSGETFECPIESYAIDVPGFLQHLELTTDDFAEAVSADRFAEAWAQFLRPTDTIAAFNSSTLKLQPGLGAGQWPAVTLKSVDLARDCSTLDQIVESLGLTVPMAKHKGRAGRRLANAAAYALYLNRLIGDKQRT